MDWGFYRYATGRCVEVTPAIEGSLLEEILWKHHHSRSTHKDLHDIGRDASGRCPRGHMQPSKHMQETHAMTDMLMPATSVRMSTSRAYVSTRQSTPD
jgi:hypothetical protein